MALKFHLLFNIREAWGRKIKKFTKNILCKLIENLMFLEQVREFTLSLLLVK